MDRGWRKALQRLLDTTAFENIGHLRDLETLLERSRRAPSVKEAGPEAAPPPAGAAANDTLTT